MIYYDYQKESWFDTNDSLFDVDMTPDGDSSELSKEFDTQVDFWKWYNNELV